jgi:hypothetical protein
MMSDKVDPAPFVQIGSGLVPEGSAAHRNSQALAQEILRLRTDYEARCTVLENRVAMQDHKILQLQNLFATQMVARGSGPTAE